MAKIAFVTFHNDFSIGINVLSSILINEGHDVSVIFFKPPGKRTIDWFKDDTGETMEWIDTSGNIVAGDIYSNRPTDLEIDLLIQQLMDSSAEIICLNSRTVDDVLAVKIYPIIRERTNAVILAGGFGPSMNPEIYADLVDYVYIGEAENSIDELISKIVSGESIRDFDNICYKENGELITNKLAYPGILKFKKTIVPNHTYYIANDKIYSFQERGAVVKTHTYSTFFGRGCVMTCSYCSAGNWRRIYQEAGHIMPMRRNRPVEDVIEELLAVKEKGITFIHFRDEFMTDKIENMKLLFKLYEREINIPFWANIMPTQMVQNPDLLEMAVDAGFVDTEIGLQSGSDKINREIFNRFIPHKNTLEYARLLAKYDVNVKYSLIIFNPVEGKEDIKKTFKLLQALPKHRAYIELSKLHYWPLAPIYELLKEYRKKPVDSEYFYRIGLLYLICFVTTEQEFDRILRDKKMNSSWECLLSFYRDYIEKNRIDFPIGTHDIPNSITTPRYERIIKKNRYSDVIIWGAGNYFEQMSHIFEGINIRYQITDDEKNIEQKKSISSPDVLSKLNESLPIFICSPRKQEIKMKIINGYPNYTGKIFV
jgi:radical SAM superfamily enzyme YgiQ (UPF0313 family)